MKRALLLPLQKENADLRARLESAVGALRNLEPAWQDAMLTAAFRHGANCNITTKERPGEGCTCGFGRLSLAIGNAAALGAAGEEQER